MSAWHVAPPPQDVTVELEAWDIEWQEMLGPDYRLADDCGRYVAGIVYEYALRAVVMDYILEQGKDVACGALYSWPFGEGVHLDVTYRDGSSSVRKEPFVGPSMLHVWREAAKFFKVGPWAEAKEVSHESQRIRRRDH